MRRYAGNGDRVTDGEVVGKSSDGPSVAPAMAMIAHDLDGVLTPKKPGLILPERRFWRGSPPATPYYTLRKFSHERSPIRPDPAIPE